jgi:predicted amidohydrolase
VSDVCRFAKELSCWILLGSVGIKVPDDTRIANRSFLISPAGEITARYDKIHMFDAVIGAGETYSESQRCRPGDTAVVASLPWGRLGMTICYDVRFPALYRALAHAGSVFLSVPSAFTQPTGAAHWETLLRARAIENGCFVFAPAQCGVHPGERRTYGHALIVDPWGRVLADAGDGVGFVCADIDLGEVARARERLPVLLHERPFHVAQIP